MVQVASAAVGSRRSRIRSVTRFLKKNDSPRSPRARLPSQIANCWTTGRSRPSLARISATCCPVALSPAMMAAGSPVVRRRSRNTKVATTAMTGMVATRRRAMYWYSKGRGLAALLLHVPEHGHGRGDVALHVLADGGTLVPLTDVDMGRILRHAHLHGLGDGLELGGVVLAGELVAQALDLLVARPAEHGLVAPRVEVGRHHGVQDVGGHPRGEARVPAA